jgi:hypothetical protein
MGRRMFGSMPGESPHDPVFGHTVEGDVIPGAVIDDSRSETFARNCALLGALTAPPVEYDPLFDGPNPEPFINQSTKVEGETS